MTVGAIESIDHANTVIGAGRADLCAIARGHSSDPYMSLRGSIEHEVSTHPWPKQHLAVRPRKS